jgi:hypothetical protein
MVEKAENQRENFLAFTKFSNSHPYEYLTQLNKIYLSYNKTTGNDYSIASRVKLPFKKFTIAEIPKCF